MEQLNYILLCLGLNSATFYQISLGIALAAFYFSGSQHL